VRGSAAAACWFPCCLGWPTAACLGLRTSCNYLNWSHYGLGTGVESCGRISVAGPRKWAQDGPHVHAGNLIVIDLLSFGITFMHWGAWVFWLAVLSRETVPGGLSLELLSASLLPQKFISCLLGSQNTASSSKEVLLDKPRSAMLLLSTAHSVSPHCSQNMGSACTGSRC
jgi:hypothetical protein